MVPHAEILFVAGKDNPADLLTRGVSINTFRKSRCWFYGPSWLTNTWPAQNINTVIIEEPISLYTNTNVSDPVTESIFDIERYGNYSKLLRVVAYVFRYFTKLRINPFKVQLPDTGYNGNNISIDEIIFAENYLIKLNQSTYYSSIYDHFYHKTKSIPIINQLKLYIDNGVIRSRGRLENSELPVETKFPILLPNCLFTKLLIRDAHWRIHHGGINETLSYIRQKFWIPKARTLIKSVLRKCVLCNKVQCKPFPPPPTPPLPLDRVSNVKPFQICGVDYTGAISVKSGSTIVKAYIALFTCANTRAVHLEVVSDNSESEFISALIRFVSRRSYPQIMYSDNVTYFVAASKTLQKNSRTRYVIDKLNEHRIKWKFITPRAPSHGGMWERLIGLMKTSLKKVLGNALISIDELRTIIVQIEAKLNDRPLTYITDDNKDLQPVTPSTLMFGYRLIGFPHSVDVDEILDPSYERERITNRQKYIF